jgi:stage II sporulation protein AB (anti-sigma F factor)
VIEAFRDETKLILTVEDRGKGIADVEQAMQPAYTTDPERMGLGFVFMKSFMDHLEVTSRLGEGTKVIMTKNLNPVDAVN